MEMLKQYFPFAFTAKNDITALVINVILHIIVGAVIGLVISLLALIPILGIIFGLIGGIVDLYILISAVLSCLDYFKILK